MSKRLTIAQKSEIINELSKQNHVTKKSFENNFGVSEAVVLNTWKNRESIRKRSADIPENYRNKKSKILARRYVLIHIHPLCSIF